MVFINYPSRICIMVIAQRLHHGHDAQKRIRCESGTMPSLCKGAASKPTGELGRGSGDDRSQENCLGEELRICGTQNLYSHSNTYLSCF